MVLRPQKYSPALNAIVVPSVVHGRTNGSNFTDICRWIFRIGSRCQSLKSSLRAFLRLCYGTHKIIIESYPRRNYLFSRASFTPGQAHNNNDEIQIYKREIAIQTIRIVFEEIKLLCQECGLDKLHVEIDQPARCCEQP